MGAHVHVPIRVVVDARALVTRRDDILGATQDALTRALARSAREAAPVAAGRPVRLGRVGVDWTGAGLDSADGEAMAQIEAALRTTLATALDGEALSEAARAAGPAEGPVEGVASERVRPERLDLRRMIYRMPSYNDDGELVDVEIADSDAADQATAADPETPEPVDAMLVRYRF